MIGLGIEGDYGFKPVITLLRVGAGVARKRLVIIWHVLDQRRVAHQVYPEREACPLVGSKMGLIPAHSLSNSFFD
jgi:hypothetical protein